MFSERVERVAGLVADVLIFISLGLMGGVEFLAAVTTCVMATKLLLKGLFLALSV